MRLSFVVPNYNKDKKQIVEAIVSLVKQTRPVHEILFVDDGSTDRSFFGEIGRISPLVKTILRPHLGPGPARNYAIECATGTHIAFLDSDDILSPFFVETAELVLKENVDLVLFGVSDCLGEAPPNLHSLTRLRGQSARSFFSRTNWQAGGLEIRSAWGKVYSLAFLRNHGIRFPELFQGEDVAFNFHVSFFVESIAVLPGFSSYCYVQNATSSSGSFSDRKYSQFQEEAATLLRLAERFCATESKNQEAYYNIVCEIIPAALKTYFCHPLNQNAFLKRYSSFLRFLKEEPAFRSAIRNIRAQTCPTKRKIHTVRLHKLGFHLPVFLYYERKLRWAK